MNRSLFEAEQDARRIVNWWSAGAACVGMVTWLELLARGNRRKIVHDVAKAFDVTAYSVEEVTAAVSATFAGKLIASEAIGLVPGFGQIVKASIAAGTTKALGETIVAYFRSRSMLT